MKYRVLKCQSMVKSSINHDLHMLWLHKVFWAKKAWHYNEYYAHIYKNNLLFSWYLGISNIRMEIIHHVHYSHSLFLFKHRLLLLLQILSFAIARIKINLKTTPAHVKIIIKFLLQWIIYLIIYIIIVIAMNGCDCKILHVLVKEYILQM